MVTAITVNQKRGTTVRRVCDRIQRHRDRPLGRMCACMTHTVLPPGNWADISDLLHLRIVASGARSRISARNQLPFVPEFPGALTVFPRY